MKLWGVSMVRNEADIIEAFVRHNLSRIDGLLVVDHGSHDRTLEILAALCAEKLPLVVMRNEAPGYLQAEVMTTAARTAFTRAGADFVFALDADEFVKVASRERLEAFLRGVPPGTHVSLEWMTYVPPFDDAPRGIVATARAARRALTGTTLPRKMLLSRALLTQPEATLEGGSHRLVDNRDLARARPVPTIAAPAEVAAIAHLPVRSRRQHAIKISIRALARNAAGRGHPPGSYFRDAYEAVRDGREMDWPEMLNAHVHGFWQRPPDGAAAQPVALVADPFIADIAMRHTPAVDAPVLPLVVSAVERRTRSLVATRAQRVPGS